MVDEAGGTPTDALALCWNFRALRNDRTVGWHQMGADAELQLERLKQNLGAVDSLVDDE